VDFQTWLLVELRSRGWSQAELARRAKISKAAISNILSNQRKPGPELCEAIAKAFNVSPEIVFREAKIFPPLGEKDIRLDEIGEIYKKLEEDGKQELLEQSRFRLRLQEERGSYGRKEQ
jgi:transcriptional regulator with XRE-family HTH domain